MRVMSAPGAARGESVVLQADETAVSSIMQRRFLAAAPETTISTLKLLLLDSYVNAIPVVRGGELVGIVSKCDLLLESDEPFDDEPVEGASPVEELEFGLRRSRAEPLAEDVMSSYAFVVPPSASIALVAALMHYEGVHQLPVTRGRTLVGMVDALDVLRWLGTQCGYGPNAH